MMCRFSFVLLFFSSVFAGLVKQGRWTVDEIGRVVMLRGVNQVNKRPPYTHAAVGFDADDAQLIADYGFNVIRLGITWAAIEPIPGNYDVDYFASIVDTIRLLKSRNINVLLDMHQDAYAVVHGGAGFPDWAALGTGTNNIGFPYIYFGNFVFNGKIIDTVVDEDFDAFWQNKAPNPGEVGIQTRFISMIGEVAKVLMQESNVIGIDVMNEPFPGVKWIYPATFGGCLTPTGGFQSGCPAWESGVYSDFLQAVLGAIRPHSNKIVYWEPSGTHAIGDSVPSFVRNLNDDQLGYSYHNYFSKNWSSVFAMVEPNTRTNHETPLLTEFGAEVNVSEWNANLALADQYLHGWTYWTYTNNPVYEFTSLPDDLPADPRAQGIVYDATAPLVAPNADPIRLQELSRPYPRATAGIPQSLVFNKEEGRFTYEFTYDPCQMGFKTTEIFIPNHSFPLRTKYEIEGKAKLQSVSSELGNGRVMKIKNQLPPTGKGLCGRQELVSITVERCGNSPGCAPLV